MSTHPNAILLCVLKPDSLTRKTVREIRLSMGVGEDSDSGIKIAGTNYHIVPLEEDYDDNWQIGANEGDILVFDLVTYGYGEKIGWDDLSAQKEKLEVWAKEICEKFSCAYKIWITANYW